MYPAPVWCVGVSNLPRRATGPLCPVSPEHGPLIGWASARWGFHCSHQDHDRTGARSFFTTEEAEAGSLAAELASTYPPTGRGASPSSASASTR